MSQKKKNISIKDILKGKFLVDDGSFRHWKFVLFLALLAFGSIISSHWADKKVVKIRHLQKESSNLKSESAYLHKVLMQAKMESEVAERVLNDSIKRSNVQPYLMVDNSND